MRKVIATFTIILIILNIYRPYSYSATLDVFEDSDLSPETFNMHMENGTGPITVKEGEEEEVVEKKLDTSGQNNGNAIVTAILEVLVIVPKIANWIMSIVVFHGESSEDYEVFTIQDLLLGKYYLFDIDFFDTSETEDPNAQVVNDIKDNVAIWYIVVRTIAVLGCALTLIYIAIRLAIATLSSDPAKKAKYQKYFTSWLIGVILIFVVLYLVRLAMEVNKTILKILNDAILSDSSTANFEDSILTDTWNNIERQKGINKLWYVVIYWMLVYYEVKFFIMYFKRSFEIFFLMIICPLVCMIYPIDFVGDGRSQSFGVWFKELINNIFMQAIHLIIFIVFVFSASELAKEMPLVAVAFFGTLSNGEKIIKQIFGLNSPRLKDTKIKRFRFH